MDTIILKQPVFSTIRVSALILFFLLISGCSQFASNAKQDFADNLSQTILSYDDPTTVAKAVPAYLLLISSMIGSEPDNVDLLDAGAKLYGAYASAFVEPGNSKKALAQHAFDYASRSICLRYPPSCHVQHLSLDEYKRFLKKLDVSQAGSLFLFASTWAGVIEAESGNWNKIAELPQVKASIQRVIELDGTIDDGNAHVYMGVLDTLLPPALGGKPVQAKKQFEQAIAISHGKNLMAKVLYAEKYARLLFKRKLHDRLLHEVVAAKIENNENRLINTLAKQKAIELLKTANDYF